MKKHTKLNTQYIYSAHWFSTQKPNSKQNIFCWHYQYFFTFQCEITKPEKVPRQIEPDHESSSIVRSIVQGWRNIWILSSQWLWKQCIVSSFVENDWQHMPHPYNLNESVSSFSVEDSSFPLHDVEESNSLSALMWTSPSSTLPSRTQFLLLALHIMLHSLGTMDTSSVWPGIWGPRDNFLCSMKFEKFLSHRKSSASGCIFTWFSRRLSSENGSSHTWQTNGFPMLFNTCCSLRSWIGEHIL